MSEPAPRLALSNRHAVVRVLKRMHPCAVSPQDGVYAALSLNTQGKLRLVRQGGKIINVRDQDYAHIQTLFSVEADDVAAPGKEEAARRIRAAILVAIDVNNDFNAAGRNIDRYILNISPTDVPP